MKSAENVPLCKKMQRDEIVKGGRKSVYGRMRARHVHVRLDVKAGGLHKVRVGI